MRRRADQSHTPNRARRVILWIAGGVLFVLLCIAIHYRGVKPIVTAEYGAAVPTAADYTKRDAVLSVDTNKYKLGWHVLNLDIGGFPTPVLLHVRDTVAPQAQGADRMAALGHALGPDAFVTGIRDADVVKLTFQSVPDFDTENETDVTIQLSDSSGNTSTVTAHLSVRATVPTLTREAGAETPTVEDFLMDGVRGTLDEPIDDALMHCVGTTSIGVTTEDGVHSVSVLCVVDTAGPTAVGGMRLLLPNETVTPQDCVTDAADETALTFAFAEEPDYASRTVQDLTVRVTDEGGNVTDVPVQILISGVRPKTVEARTEPLNVEDFHNDEGDAITVPDFVPNVPGTYPIDILTNGVPQTVAVTVVDTTAPQIVETELPELYTKHAYAPELFFDASDVSAVQFRYAAEPDWTQVGEQIVSVIAADPYGNETAAQRTVMLQADEIAPNIYGVINRMCYVNETIAYRKEVFAEDDVDGRLEVAVESEVVPYAEGTYRVVYRATDRSGNEATAECMFTLIEQTVTEEEIRAIAQQVMAEITTPDMVDVEKLKAIFDYVQKHVVYVNGSNSNYTDWRKAAYDGYTYGKGDCYNIYSLTRTLLDETDIPYLSVERVKAYPYRTRHFWVHVNVGTGWYVFDPTWTPRHRAYCFMWTERQCGSFRNYWNHDKTKYPPLATDIFDYDAVLAAQRQAQTP